MPPTIPIKIITKELGETIASDVFVDASLSGIAQLDLAVHGEPYAIVGRLSLYAREQSEGHGGRSLEWDLVEERLEPVASIALLRRSVNVVLKYKACGLSVSQVYNKFEELLGYVDHKLCVGALRDGDVVVFFRKNDMKSITTFNIEGPGGAVLSPVLYRFKTRGNICHEMDETLIMLSKAVGDTMTNLAIVMPRAGEFSFDQLYTSFAKLSPPQKLRLKGMCEAVPVKKRNEFETVVLRCYASLTKCQAVKEKTTAMIFPASRPPWPVCPLEFLIGMDQRGSRLLEQTSGQFEHISLRQLVRDPTLMSRYGIVLASPMTGIGKTMFACRLAMEWSLAAVAAAGLPSSRAQVVFTNSFDAARSITFDPYMVWVIDEVSPGDSNQLAFSSENILKVLLNPSMAGTINAKHGSIELPALVPRIFTCNNTSASDWCSNGGRNKSLKWELLHARKSIWFQLKEPLCLPDWKAKATLSGILEDCSSDAVLEAARPVMLAAAARIPASVARVEPQGGLRHLFCPSRTD